MSEVARASGKVILLGEHAVVYGVPALAVGIDRGARAESAPLAEGPSELEIAGWGIQARDEDADAGEEPSVARAFRALAERTRERRRELGLPELGPVRVSAEADLPPGGGLGCSAAVGVAIARALDPSADAEEIALRAGAWEKVFHGNPSGVDAAVSAAGGCVWFERGKGVERVAMGAPLLLCVGNTGVASSTKTMVEAVAKLRERRPEIAEKSFEGIRSLVRNARLALEAGDVVGLGRLMDLNQMLLAGLFVSTEEIERMCGLARDAGALGAKLTGAGGGGSVVALVPSPEVAERVLFAWEKEGFSSFFARASSHESASRPAHPEPAP